MKLSKSQKDILNRLLSNKYRLVYVYSGRDRMQSMFLKSETEHPPFIDVRKNTFWILRDMNLIAPIKKGLIKYGEIRHKPFTISEFGKVFLTENNL